MGIECTEHVLRSRLLSCGYARSTALAVRHEVLRCVRHVFISDTLCTVEWLVIFDVVHSACPALPMCRGTWRANFNHMLLIVFRTFPQLDVFQHVMDLTAV